VSATLHLLCGKIGSGKSTLAARLAETPGTVLISEDVWLSALFGDELRTGQDFMRCSTKLRAVLGPHIVGLLKVGTSVVLDGQANTAESRFWMRGLIEESGAAHQMHVLLADDALCLARLKARNASGLHPFEVSEAMFHRFSAHFSPPAPAEGFRTVEHPQS